MVIASEAKQSRYSVQIASSLLLLTMAVFERILSKKIQGIF